MSKRKLSQQQKRRIQQQQQRRIQQVMRSDHTEQVAEGEKGLLIARYGASVDVENDSDEIIRCQLRQNLANCVAGDQVIWSNEREAGVAVVTAVLPRSSELLRPDPQGKLKPIAANIDQMFLVIAPLPTFSPFLIDRYLVAAEALGVKTTLICNKWDLLQDSERAEVEEQLAIYQKIGYRVIFTSTVRSSGCDLVAELAKNNMSIFVGQSGVGKSSLIHALLPGQSLKIGEISDNSQLGMHTTTTTRVYRFPQGGRLIDSPGVRDFDLWQESAQEIMHGFIDFKPWSSQCKFRNCIHLKEPGCAVIAAAAMGDIPAIRLESYHRLIKDIVKGNK